MAFSFNGGASFGSATQNSGASAQRGEDLPEIQTDQLGFLPISGDCKLQLLSEPWPADALPPPSASLLTVASSKGLVAAAGPNELVIANTDSIRNAWMSGETPENNVKPFNPEARITVPRLSHVAFSADENVLVVVGESNGGLAVYKTEGLTSGQTNPVLEVPTNNQALRALVPNPNVQSAELFGVVTTNGELLMANWKAGQLLPGANGAVLKSGVSCLSWSNQGKQLVAGLADGTAVQMTPDGAEKAMIPRPPSLEGDKHVTTIAWLANDMFFIVYSFNSNSDDAAQPSDYFMVSRQPKTQNYIFQALPEVCPSFGLNRSPACHFVARLRKFEPHIEDLLLLASTTAIDLGIVTNSDAPLSRETAVTNSYTLTMPAEDAKRAQLPLSLNEDGTDTSPIGLGLDLSAKDTIVSPIPSDPEIEQSPGPLPNILALNHEGLLASWWIVYADSIRENKTYPGLAVVGGSEQAQKQTTSTPVQSSPASASASGQPTNGTPALGQSGFASQQPFVKPATSTFGMGSDSKFGSPSLLSGDKPSWTSTGFGGVPAQAGSSGFGQPGFGTSTPMGGLNSAFGAPSPLAGKPPFGQPGASANPGSGATFGQTSAFGGSKPQPFGSGGSASPFGGLAGEGSGFAAFSKGGAGGFSALAANQSGQESPFAKAGQKDAAFPLPAQSSLFGPKVESNENEPAFSGLEGNNFSIGSTFKRDETSKDDESKSGDAGGVSFGDGLGDALEQTNNDTPPAQSKEEEMEEGGAEPIPTPQDQEEDSAPLPDEPKPQSPAVTPPSTISQPKTTPAPPLAGLFPTNSQPGTTPAAVQNSKPGLYFQEASSTTPKETPKVKPFTSSPPSQDEEQPPKIKTEPSSETSSPTLRSTPEAPLPPESITKTRYPADTSESSDASKISNDDTPLPPVDVPKQDDSSHDASQAGPPDEDEEEDDFSSDFEGSGENDTHEISPIDEPTGDQAEQIQTSPESSFGRGPEGSHETSPTGGLFTKVSTSKSSKLFGEVTGPIFPAPVTQESPRSPSPIRNVPKVDLVRPEAGRSVSAPTRPHSASALDRRRAELSKSALASQPINAGEIQDKDKQRAAAAEQAKAIAEAEASQALEDDEDARLRAELESPPSPSEHLEPFVPHQHGGIDTSNKSGIPGQIERLYQDINSMIDTLGINARSLSSYLLYQTSQEPSHDWPEILTSETPQDALNGEWVLQDITRLDEGDQALSTLLDKIRMEGVSEKFEQCQELLNHDLVQLRLKLASARKALHASIDAESRTSAPLSAEQTSLQHDLRKASTLVQTKLVEAEQAVTFLRAKLAEVRPSQENGTNGSGAGMVGRSALHKRPTVEAVTSTIFKMTAMAEKRSGDIDVLEAQLRKMGFSSSDSTSGDQLGLVEANGRSQLGINGLAMSQRTPKSGAGSVYHTPESKFGGSTRSTPGTFGRSLRASVDVNGALVSNEDAERWKEKARRKKAIHRLLKETLAERRKTTRTTKA